jgi:hypothetical protein
MSLFKKDINEHDEFFDMVRDYVIAKAAAGKVRLASASNTFALDSIGKTIMAQIEDGSYERRERLRSKAAPTSDDFEKLRNTFRAKLFEGTTAKVNEGVSRPEARQQTLMELKEEFGASENSLVRRVRDFLITGLYGRMAGQLRTLPNPESAVTQYIHVDNDPESKASGFLDYLLDYAKDPEGKILKDGNGKPVPALNVQQPAEKIVSALGGAIMGGIGLSQKGQSIKEQKGTIGLETSLKGGKADTADVTIGEGIANEALSVEEQATATPTDSLKKFVSLYGQATNQLRRRITNLDPTMDANQIKILNLELSAAEAKIPVIKATKDLLEKIDGLLAAKSRLFEQNKSKILSEEEIQKYSSVDEQLRSDLAKVSDMISQIAPSSAEGALANVRENINELAMEYTIPGLSPEPIAEIAEPEEDDAPALPGAKKARKPRVKPIPVGMTAVSPQAYQAFMDKGSQYLEEMIPDLYAGLHYAPGSELQTMYGKGPLRSTTQAIPYARGLQTKAQLEAIQSGDADDMQAAGVDVISQFKRELLALMSEQNLNYIWQQSGRTVPGVEGSKKSSRKIFNQKLEELRQDPRFASNPEISGPGGMIDQYLKTPGAGQETFDQFDMVRRSAEYMRALRESGKYTFAELTDEDIESAADNSINREGSHYGENQAMWLKGHKPYFDLSPEVMKAIMVKELMKLRADSSKEGARSIKFTDIEMPSGDLQPKNVGYKGRQKVTPEITTDVTPDVTPDVEASSRRFKRFASAEPAENVDFMANEEDLLDIWKNNPDLRGELSGLLVD